MLDLKKWTLCLGFKYTYMHKLGIVYFYIYIYQPKQLLPLYSVNQVLRYTCAILNITEIRLQYNTYCHKPFLSAV